MKIRLCHHQLPDDCLNCREKLLLNAKRNEEKLFNNIVVKCFRVCVSTLSDELSTLAAFALKPRHSRKTPFRRLLKGLLSIFYHPYNTFYGLCLFYFLTNALKTSHNMYR